MRLLILLLLLFLPVGAHAAFFFCNKQAYPVEGAIGYREGLKWVSEGWWRVAPEQCLKVVGQPLDGRFYYYYGRTISGESIEWGGKFVFCIDDKPFRIEGDGECEPRNFYSAGFAAIDVQDEKDFYLDFK